MIPSDEVMRWLGLDKLDQRRAVSTTDERDGNAEAEWLHPWVALVVIVCPAAVPFASDAGVSTIAQPSARSLGSQGPRIEAQDAVSARCSRAMASIASLVSATIPRIAA